MTRRADDLRRPRGSSLPPSGYGPVSLCGVPPTAVCQRCAPCRRVPALRSLGRHPERRRCALFHLPPKLSAPVLRAAAARSSAPAAAALLRAASRRSSVMVAVASTTPPQRRNTTCGRNTALVRGSAAPVAVKRCCDGPSAAPSPRRSTACLGRRRRCKEAGDGRRCACRPLMPWSAPSVPAQGSSAVHAAGKATGPPT